MQTTLPELSRQMFKQKSKYVYLMIILQVISTVILSIYELSQENSSGIEDILRIFYHISYLMMILLDIVFCGLMCWQNEKMNLSQTWRQVLITSIKFYLANIISTLVGCIYYLFAVQMIFNCLLSFPKINQPILDVLGITAGYNPNLIMKVITSILFLFLVVITISTFVSFTNFITKIIVDVLPVKSTIWIRMLAIGILVVIAAYIAFQMNDHFESFLMTRIGKQLVDQNHLETFNSLEAVDIEFIIISIILGGLDLFFISRFIEPKKDN